YNRLGLMDTPCTLLMVAGWWTAIRGRDAFCNAGAGRDDSRAITQAQLWYCFSGIILGAAYSIRGMAAFIWWLPLVYISGEGIGRNLKRASIRCAIAYGGGLGLAIYIYIFAWWRPHHAELAYMNHHYIQYQLLPHSLKRLGTLIGDAFRDWQRGLF